MLLIAVTTPKGQRAEEECTIDSCTIGKSDENRIILQGWSVGRSHATIHRRKDGVYVQDHGASSGTKVNNQKVADTYGPLKADDQITICDYVIEVLNVDQEDAAATAPAAAAVTTKKAVIAEPKTDQVLASQIAETILVLKNLHLQLIKQMDLRRVDVNRQSEDELRENTRAMLEEIVAAIASMKFSSNAKAS